MVVDRKDELDFGHLGILNFHDVWSGNTDLNISLTGAKVNRKGGEKGLEEQNLMLCGAEPL